MTRTLLRIAIVGVLLVASGATPIPGARAAAQDEPKQWIVIFHQQQAIPAGAEAAVEAAGGSIAARLPEIGALVAASADPDFAAKIGRDPQVSDVAEDVVIQMIPDAASLRLQDASDLEVSGAGPVEEPGSDTQTGPDPLYPLQWDKKRIRASNQGSYAVQQGRPEVTVAVLDTGAQVLPAPHPDIHPNLDYARSRAFFPVTANPDGDANPAAWDDRNGHGSFCLSTVAAPINGFGMVGVAPRVRLVALKVLGDDGGGSFVALAQALIYTGVHRFDVASMSLAGYLRHADQGSHALIELLSRAVSFARSRGVTPVAALSNESFNVSDGSFFRDFIVVPAEISGVIGVSATGYFNQKASYSNYGVGKTDVSAPGGDGGVQTTPGLFGAGNVLGAWAPDNPFVPGAVYVFASGTSMATPQAAGVAALIISQYGDFTPDNGTTHMSPQAVESILQQTANNQPCPEPREVSYFLAPPAPPDTPVPDVFPNQRCQGDAGYNNFFGKGMVDALKAVTAK